MARRIVGISGNITRPSRTNLLVKTILAEIARRGLGDTACYDLIDAGPALGAAVSRRDAPEPLEHVWREIETCDVLVVGSPVYKGSYTGLLKHLFDLLDIKALVGRPVLLAATGRIDHYAMVIDHQLRPLFGFFGALTLPLGVFVTEKDFVTATEFTDDVPPRIAAAVDHLAVSLGRHP
jgi:FMN reductase